MKALHFEELQIWRAAVDLDAKVYLLFKTNKNLFRQFDLQNQMIRSAGSIADNIAEGFDRNGNREFIQFLAIAKGSCAELRSQFWRCANRELLDDKIVNEFVQQCLALSASIGRMMQYLKNSEFKGAKFKK